MSDEELRKRLEGLYKGQTMLFWWRLTWFIILMIALSVLKGYVQK